MYILERVSSTTENSAAAGHEHLGRARGRQCEAGDVLVKALSRLDSWAKTFWAPLAVVLIVLVAWLDIITGYELSFSLFYLVPIFVVA